MCFKLLRREQLSKNIYSKTAPNFVTEAWTNGDEKALASHFGEESVQHHPGQNGKNDMNIIEGTSQQGFTWTQGYPLETNNKSELSKGIKHGSVCDRNTEALPNIGEFLV